MQAPCLKTKQILTVFIFLLFLFLFSKNIYASSEHLLINEIFPNPTGTDLGYEWIEIYNPTENEIDITNWKFQVAGTKFVDSFTITSTNSVKADTYFLICERLVQNCDYYVERIGMQNGGTETDGIRILDTNLTVIDTILYDNPNSNNLQSDRTTPAIEAELSPAPQSNATLSRVSNEDLDMGSDFRVTIIPTPKSPNNIQHNISIEEVSAYTGFVELNLDINEIYGDFVLKINNTSYNLENISYPIYVFHFDPQYKPICVELISVNGTTIDKLCEISFSTQYSTCKLQDIAICTPSPGEPNSLYIPTKTISVINSEVLNNKYFDIEGCVKTFDQIQIFYDSTGGIKISDFELQSGCYVLELKKEIDKTYVNHVYSTSDVVPTPVNILNEYSDWDFVSLVCQLSSYEKNTSTYQFLCNKTTLYITSNTLCNSKDILIKGFLSPFSKDTRGNKKYRLFSEIIEQVENDKTKLSSTGNPHLFLLKIATLILFIISFLSVTLQNISKFKCFIYGKKESWNQDLHKNSHKSCYTKSSRSKSSY
jgi:hypothetical protein